MYYLAVGEMDLVTTLLHLYDVSLETLELHLDAFSPHLPTNREIAIALSNLRTRVLIVSQRGEIRYWKAMARTMLVSQLRVLLPLGPGPAYDDLFDKNYFPERGDLNFIIIAAPKDHFFILPAEARKLIYELLLLESQEIRPLDSEVDAWIYPRWTPPWQKLGQSTGLLRACKQLSREATAVLYGNNVFGLLSQDARDADRWLRNIGSTNRRMIRYIRIDTDHAIRAWARYSLGRWNAERGPPRPFTNVLGHRIMAHAQAMELAIQSDFARATASCCTSTMMCLQLLQDCSNLSRLELFVPSWYHLDYRYPAALRFGACQGVAEVCQSIYNAIGHLYISTELRINCKVVTKDLVAVGVRLGLERLVVFWPKRFDDHQGQGIMVDQCDRDYWQAGEDRNELLIQFRPAKYGTDDTAIDAIWPKGST